MVSLGEPNIYQNLGGFTRIGDFTWRVSDCEELEEDKFLNRFVTNYFTLKFNAVILIDSNFVHTLWVAETLEFILDHSLISLYGETF